MTDEKPDKKPKVKPAGQIVKRGERKYLVRIFLGRDKETGARSWYNKTFHVTETDAKKWLTMALRRNETRLKAGPKWKAHDLVFCNSTGETYSVGYHEKEWKKTLTAAGLPATFRSYDARHTTATLLLQDKLSPKVVSERFGHANVMIDCGLNSL